MKTVLYSVASGLILLSIGAAASSMVRVSVLETELTNQKEVVSEIKSDMKEIKGLLLRILTKVQ